MDAVPVVFGSGKPFFGSVDAQRLLEDPDAVIQGDRVLHLRLSGAPSTDLRFRLGRLFGGSVLCHRLFGSCCSDLRRRP